ncbi:hypothetical protein JOB18_003800 [Solea senegalensis]|uniref:Uncharacterized protein n=1 Tax=Solea senegalensis TaxID=28829 RepID=A0AAV6SQC8_SOLSE|nr:hypothetical protein JOB18_003800 [Solea senegalensis]
MNTSGGIGKTPKRHWTEEELKGCGHSTSCEQPQDLLRVVIACEHTLNLHCSGRMSSPELYWESMRVTFKKKKNFST